MSDTRVTANEPTKDAGSGSTPDDGARPHGTVLPDPADSNARSNAIDDGTAGDGVAFFEGGDGREEARGDVEREG